ncbi:hypothetical protein K525DRAFT_273202 [Schizophyllum commune Loenen D]|nr:hypothetical protein K525DRAFT_273202 [Schizophyllum commune Loenen D]
MSSDKGSARNPALISHPTATCIGALPLPFHCPSAAVAFVLIRMSVSGPQQRATPASTQVSQPPAAFAYNYDNSLEQPAEFLPFSFVFNTVERLMICQLCDCVVRDISTHLNKQHKTGGRLAAVDRALLRKKLKELGGAENAPAIQPSLEPRPIIAGLAVEWAFTCTHCTLARTERRHAARHVREKTCHPAASLSERVQCQRPYKKELIRVFLPPSTTNPVLLSFHRFERAQASPVAGAKRLLSMDLAMGAECISHGSSHRWLQPLAVLDCSCEPAELTQPG